MTDATISQPASAAETKPRPLAGFRKGFAEFAERPLAVVGLGVFAAIALAAIFAPWLSPQNPYDLNVVSILDARLPPGTPAAGDYTHWLGTDGLGRDMFSAILYGLRISLAVGAMSAVWALMIGVVLGLLAAYHGGWVDSLIMRIVDFQLGFPPILLALILLALLGQGIDKTIIALVAVQWAYYARTIRGAALVERSKEYVLAARCLELPSRRIILRHILPNAFSPLIVVMTMQVAHAIALEATLSFLGIGMPVTQPSLGLLISNGFEFLLSGRYWISVYPGIALLITIVSINLIGDRLRDMLNPMLKR